MTYRYSYAVERVKVRESVRNSAAIGEVMGGTVLAAIRSRWYATISTCTKIIKILSIISQK